MDKTKEITDRIAIEALQRRVQVLLSDERRKFAAMAMQGMLTAETEDYKYTTKQDLAVAAIEQADALIAELDRREQEREKTS